MDLNNPDIRQSLMRERLNSERPLILAECAQEYGVSVDTIRRDLIALEEAGHLKRVRGGAISLQKPAAPMTTKLQEKRVVNPALVGQSLNRIDGAKTLLLDGGTTILAIARALRPSQDLVVITPSPWVSIACIENGIKTILIGGQLSGLGGIGVGADTIEHLSELAVDFALLGACGVDAKFGLTSDDFLESMAKRQMSVAANKTIVIADNSKINKRARHKTLAPSQFDVLITDASPDVTLSLQAQGLEIDHV